MKGDEVERACSMNEKENKYIQVSCSKVKRKGIVWKASVYILR
jgi:hypothetical protein